MKTPNNTEARGKLIALLRNAVRSQIEFWGLAREVAELIDVELSLVIEFCQDAAIFAETGLELGQIDLERILRLANANPSKIRTGGSWTM
ncbi:MAG TPA: hypothetical protein VIB39_15665 [Candidatus Angelobacter sp.]|jgi:hypothetical protein